MEARILGPTMIQKGYGKGYSAAAIAVGSLIIEPIPPSIGLIRYAGNVSIGRLFLAGVIPGLLMASVLMFQAPQQLATFMLGGFTDPNLIVLAILLFLLVAGLALDSTVMVLLLTRSSCPSSPRSAWTRCISASR